MIRKNKLTTQEIIIKSKQALGDSLNYELTNYVDSKTKFHFECKIHGMKSQSLHNHLKYGCTGCNQKHQNKKKTNQEYVEEANLVHDCFYDYSNLDYIGINSNIIISCPIHGKFKQNALRHLNGRGCPNCFKENSKIYFEFFVNRSNLIHENFYFYDEKSYVNTTIKTKIICPEHGEFWQAPHYHMLGKGCSVCGRYYRVSKKEIAWLNLINIKKEWRGLIIPSTKLIADALDLESKIVYEFYGDYYHGNPKIYKSNKLNPTANKTYGQLYQETLNREQRIKDIGYQVVSIWENEFDLQFKT